MVASCDRVAAVPCPFYGRCQNSVLNPISKFRYLPLAIFYSFRAPVSAVLTELVEANRKALEKEAGPFL